MDKKSKTEIIIAITILFLAMFYSITNNPFTFRNIGDYYSHEKKYDIANYFYIKSANKGDEPAIINLIYNHTRNKEFEEAYKWIEILAKKENSIGLKLKGLFLIEGMATKKDIEEGYKYLEKSANKGEKSAMLLAGICKIENKKNDQDIETAKNWLKKAKEIKDNDDDKNEKLTKELEELIQKNEK